MNIRDSICRALTDCGGLDALRDSRRFYSTLVDLCETSAAEEEAQRSLLSHNYDDRLFAPLIEAGEEFPQNPNAFEVAANRIARILIDERSISETAARKLGETLANGCLDYLVAQSNLEPVTVSLLPETPEEYTVKESDTLSQVAPVPNLCGMELSQAQRALDLYHPFVVGRVSHEESSDVLKDHVITQQPQPGSMIHSGSAIDLVVSAGKGTHTPTLPIVAAAIALIVAAVLFATHPWSQGGATGGQGGGGTTESGTKPVEQTFTVPSLTGLTEDAARELVTAGGTFTIGKVSYRYSDTVEEGIVISQDPKADTTTKETTIDIDVSKGPEEPKGPVIDTKTANEATRNALQQGHTALMDGTLYYRLFEGNYSQSIASRDSSGSVSQHALPVGSKTDGSYGLIAADGRLYYGVGYDSNGDQKYDGGTIYSNNPSFTDEVRLANQSPLPGASFMRFFVMGDRVYYNDKSSVRSVRLDGSGDRIEASLDGAQYFCWNDQLYLVKNMSSFSCVDTDGESGDRFTVNLSPFDDFTLSDDSVITIAGGGAGMSLSWYDLANGSDTKRGSATIPESYGNYKGAAAYGDDAIVITQEGDGGTARIYRVQRDGTVSKLWERSGLQLVRRPNVLGDRVYFWVHATADSTCSTRSITVYGGDYQEL